MKAGRKRMIPRKFYLRLFRHWHTLLKDARIGSLEISCGTLLEVRFENQSVHKDTSRYIRVAKPTWAGGRCPRMHRIAVNSRCHNLTATVRAWEFLVRNSQIQVRSFVQIILNGLKCSVSEAHENLSQKRNQTQINKNESGSTLGRHTLTPIILFLSAKLCCLSHFNLTGADALEKSSLLVKYRYYQN